MRVQSLLISNFGHFTDTSLKFASSGIQVIYGPNEAGKTTLLEFLRSWLFDFDPRTPYDFRSGSEVSGSGEILLGDGRLLELRRRKGNRDKISVRINGIEANWDDSHLIHAFGNANRNLFESVFAFGLKELAAGEVSLKHDSLKSALFGGGLGIAASPEEIDKNLTQKADELFKANRKATNPLINSLLRETKDLADKINKSNLKSEEYHRKREQVETLEQQAVEVKQQLDRVRIEHSRLTRLHKALPKWSDRQRLQLELATIDQPPQLPADVRSCMESHLRSIEDAERELKEIEEKSAAAKQEADALTLRPELLEHRDAISRCLQLRKSYEEARRDLPAVEKKIADLNRDIARELAELRPGWGTNELQSFSIDVALRNEFEGLAEQARKYSEYRAKHVAAIESTNNTVRDAEAELDALGDSIDIAPLLTVIAEESTYINHRQMLESCNQEQQKIERQLLAVRRKLSPVISIDTPLVTTLPIPHQETISDFAGRLDQLSKANENLARELNREQDELAKIADQARELTTRTKVPTLADRDAIRTRRDELWQAIEARLSQQSGETNPSSAELAAEYAKAVQAADDASDQIYANADVVAKREALAARQSQLAESIAQRTRQLEELETKRRVSIDQWNRLWSPCGFEPLTPEVMSRWCEHYSEACDRADRLAELNGEAEKLKQSISVFEKQLIELSDSKSDTISITLQRLRERVDREKERLQRSSLLQKQVRVERAKLESLQSQLRDGEAAEQTWKNAWQVVCERLQLPASWTPDQVRVVMDRLQATRVKLDSLPDEMDRIAAMRERIAEFTSQVQQVCEKVDAALVREPPELAIMKLDEQVKSAAAAAQEMARIQTLRSTCENQRTKCLSNLQARQVERDRLLAAANAADATEFWSTVGRFERYQELTSQIAQLDRDILLLCGNDDRSKFEAELSAIEPGLLDGQMEDLAAQIKQLDQKRSEADREAAVAKAELEALNGESAAAVYAEELSQRRATLAELVDRYIPVLLAKHLLNRVVEQFERENRPEMMATTSELLAKMTGGRYVAFERSRGSEDGIIIRRSDGAERTPSQLSTGTREQLYLAVRLAYVLHYCRQNEPLPIVMDDVLVNFDQDRMLQTFSVLAEISKSVQVLFFTCHRHVLDLVQKVDPTIAPIFLGESAGATTVQVHESKPAPAAKPRKSAAPRKSKKSEDAKLELAAAGEVSTSNDAVPSGHDDSESQLPLF